MGVDSGEGEVCGRVNCDTADADFIDRPPALAFQKISRVASPAMTSPSADDTVTLPTFKAPRIEVTTSRVSLVIAMLHHLAYEEPYIDRASIRVDHIADGRSGRNPD